MESTGELIHRLIRSLKCSLDGGDEIRFSVEITRIRNLPGLYSLDIKRLRGNVWSFKFVYQTILEYVWMERLIRRVLTTPAAARPSLTDTSIVLAISYTSLAKNST
jgi:hypothetical protein